MDKIDAIMEDMLKRAKEIDQEWLCLWLFTIQEILEKHLQETTEERGVKKEIKKRNPNKKYCRHDFVYDWKKGWENKYKCTYCWCIV